MLRARELVELCAQGAGACQLFELRGQALIVIMNVDGRRKIYLVDAFPSVCGFFPRGRAAVVRHLK